MSMPNPTGNNVFLSSTGYDLIDLRAEVVHALDEWGFDVIYHESDSFPILQGLSSHDVCLKAVDDCDIFLLIIDKNYGSLYEGTNKEYKDKKWSITRCESARAFELDKGHITFVRDTVFNERLSYSKHLEKKGNIIDFVPTYAKQIEVLEFVDEIHKRIITDGQDNWIKSFTTSVDLKNKIKKRLTPEPRESDIFKLPYFGRMKNAE